MNDPIIISDNVEALKILTEVGIADKLQPTPPYTRAHTYFEYKDCWCMGSYDKGHPDEKDNGFMVIMLPKNLISADEAFKVYEEASELSKAQPGGTMRYVPIGKERQ